MVRAAGHRRNCDFPHRSADHTRRFAYASTTTRPPLDGIVTPVCQALGASSHSGQSEPAQARSDAVAWVAVQLLARGNGPSVLFSAAKYRST